MKLEKSTLHVERGGQVGVDTTFRIQANAKAFEILSSGIYKDSIKAVIRELGTNAADSHTMANKPNVPFEVHLPNWSEPYFYVKDFGVGLSEQQVRNIYSTYFASDKTNSNEVTGCLGLGSKSPFSYVDQFTVTSIHNGLKQVWAAFLDQDGVPNLTKQTEERTTQGNGVEVRLGVKTQDFYSFRTKAAEVYMYFKVPPIIKGEQLTLPARNDTMFGERWALSNRRETPVVMMGNVGYPVNVADLGPDWNTISTVEDRELLSAGILLRMEIGDVDITASRESLKYTKRTLKSLKDLLTLASNEISLQATEKVKNAASLWEARLQVAKMNEIGCVSRILQANPPIWKRQRVTLHINVNTNSLKRAAVLEFDGSRAYGYVSRKKWSNCHYVTDIIRINPNTELFYNDAPKGAYTRLGYHCLRNSTSGSYKKVYLIEPFNGIDDATTKKMKDAHDKFIKDEQLEGIIKPVSSLPEPPKEARASCPRSAAVLKLDITSRDYRSQWKAKEIEFDDGGVYVSVDGYSWKSGDMNGHGDSLKEMLTKLHPVLGLTVDDITGVRNRSLERFQKSEDWISLEEKLKDLKMDECLLAYARAKLYNNLKLNNQDLLTNLYKHSLPQGSPIEELGEMLFGIQQAYNGSDAKAAAAAEAYISIFKNTKVPDLKDEETKIRSLYSVVKKRYPLLMLINPSLADSVGRRELAQYTHMVEADILANMMKEDKEADTVNA